MKTITLKEELKADLEYEFEDSNSLEEAKKRLKNRRPMSRYWTSDRVRSCIFKASFYGEENRTEICVCPARQRKEKPANILNKSRKGEND